MRPLILLATVWCCSAQLVYHGYPWAPLATPLLANPALVEGEGEDLNTVPIFSPFLRTGLHAGIHTGLHAGLHTGLHAGLYNGLHAGLPYSGLPLTYNVKLPEPSLEATEFPYIYTEKEESSRRKREASPFVGHYYSQHIPYAAHHHTGLLPYSGLHTYAGIHPLNTFGLGHQALGPAFKIDQEPEAEAETEAEEEEAPIPYGAYNALPVFSPISHGIYPHTGLHPYSGLHTYAGIHPLNLNTFGLGHQALGPVIKIDQEPEAEAEEEAPSRRRRDVEEVEVKLPYLHAVPTTKKVTVETKAYEGVDAATPADTKLIELTTKEHEIDVPAIKYVQPVLKYKPVTYTAHSVVPYAGLHAGIHTGLHAGLHTGFHAGLHTGLHAGLHTGIHAGLYNGLHAGYPYSGLPLSYSGLHPFGLTPYSPVLNIESSDE